MSPAALRVESGAHLDTLDLGNWCKRTSPEWFMEYLQPSPEARASFLRDRFLKVGASPENKVVTLRNAGDLEAVAMFERMAWDSNHFGVGCGRISPYCISQDVNEREHIHNAVMDKAISWANASGIRLLQRRLLSERIDEVNALESRGFHLVDNLVTLLLDLGRAREPRKTKAAGNITIRQGEPGDVGPLVAMTPGAFPDSRFVRDARLRASGGELVYAKWLENMLGPKAQTDDQKRRDSQVLVCVYENRVAGVLAYRCDVALGKLLNRDLASIELFLVGQDFRGKGIGGRLLDECLHMLKERGGQEVEASTWFTMSGPIGVYQSAGFQVKANLFTYHLWL